MIKSFEYFMDGIIDYAGLFPPASLDLETALHNYKNHMNSRNKWMLGRFIIPAGKLLITPPGDYFFSVILSDPFSREQTEGLTIFAPQINSIETKLPDKGSKLGEISKYIDTIKKVTTSAGIKETKIFIEASDPNQSFKIISLLGRMNADTKHSLGFKLRCGGINSQAFPEPNEVAAAIMACQTFDIPLKFTAGLHHPIRNHSQRYNTMQYGFLNIFSAALLAFGGKLNDWEIKDCLVDENFDNFVFTDTYFSWKNRSMPVDEIKQLRREKVIGFGSCSFKEPMADLKSLGLPA